MSQKIFHLDIQALWASHTPMDLLLPSMASSIHPLMVPCIHSPKGVQEDLLSLHQAENTARHHPVTPNIHILLLTRGVVQFDHSPKEVDLGGNFQKEEGQEGIFLKEEDQDGDQEG